VRPCPGSVTHFSFLRLRVSLHARARDTSECTGSWFGRYRTPPQEREAGTRPRALHRAAGMSMRRTLAAPDVDRAPSTARSRARREHRPGGCRFRRRKPPAASSTPRTAIHPLGAGEGRLPAGPRTFPRKVREAFRKRPDASRTRPIALRKRPDAGANPVPFESRSESSGPVPGAKPWRPRRHRLASRARSRACRWTGPARFRTSSPISRRRAALQGRVSATASSMSARRKPLARQWSSSCCLQRAPRRRATRPRATWRRRDHRRPNPRRAPGVGPTAV
jgi:hypothetical protein